MPNIKNLSLNSVSQEMFEHYKNRPEFIQLVNSLKHYLNFFDANEIKEALELALFARYINERKNESSFRLIVLNEDDGHPVDDGDLL